MRPRPHPDDHLDKLVSKPSHRSPCVGVWVYSVSGSKYLHSHLVSRLLAVHRWNPEEEVS